PNDLAAAKGIELRDRRSATREERKEAERQRDPLEILADIAKHNPFRALEMRAENNFPPPYDAEQTLRGHRCRACAEHVARAFGIDIDPPLVEVPDHVA